MPILPKKYAQLEIVRLLFNKFPVFCTAEDRIVCFILFLIGLNCEYRGILSDADTRKGGGRG